MASTVHTMPLTTSNCNASRLAQAQPGQQDTEVWQIEDKGMRYSECWKIWKKGGGGGSNGTWVVHRLIKTQKSYKGGAVTRQIFKRISAPWKVQPTKFGPPRWQQVSSTPCPRIASCCSPAPAPAPTPALAVGLSHTLACPCPLLLRLPRSHPCSWRRALWPDPALDGPFGWCAFRLRQQ